MFAINDHVTRKDTTHPIGIVEDLNGTLTATVRWGAADRHVYKEDILQEQLQLVPFEILSPDEATIKQIQESGMRYRKTEE